MPLPADVIIRGRRVDGHPVVTVADVPFQHSPLWETSLCLYNHSHARPDWGYSGSGPAQLALALLLLVTDSVEAEQHHMLFTNAVLAGIRADRWTIRVGDLRTWLEHARDGQRLLLTCYTSQPGGASALTFEAGRTLSESA